MRQDCTLLLVPHMSVTGGQAPDTPCIALRPCCWKPCLTHGGCVGRARGRSKANRVTRCAVTRCPPGLSSAKLPCTVSYCTWHPVSQPVRHALANACPAAVPSSSAYGAGGNSMHRSRRAPLGQLMQRQTVAGAAEPMGTPAAPRRVQHTMVGQARSASCTGELGLLYPGSPAVHRKATSASCRSPALVHWASATAQMRKATHAGPMSEQTGVLGSCQMAPSLLTFRGCALRQKQLRPAPVQVRVLPSAAGRVPASRRRAAERGGAGGAPAVGGAGAAGGGGGSAVLLGGGPGTGAGAGGAAAGGRLWLRSCGLADLGSLDSVKSYVLSIGTAFYSKM